MNDIMVKILRKIRKRDGRALSYLYRQNGFTAEVRTVISNLCTNRVIDFLEYHFLKEAFIKKQKLEAIIPEAWL